MNFRAASLCQNDFRWLVQFQERHSCTCTDGTKQSVEIKRKVEIEPFLYLIQTRSMLSARDAIVAHVNWREVERDSCREGHMRDEETGTT